MYVPEYFRENDPDRLAALIQEHGFATLVTARADAPSASELPLLYDRAVGPSGTLYGHLARNNPQAAELAAGRPVLAIFHGPHAYISPSWYAGPGVPTWNYAVVQARGIARMMGDVNQHDDVLDRLIAQYDPAVVDPDGPRMPLDQRQRMLGGIVGFAIEVSELTGKFKLSQNRSLEDRQRVVARLAQSESDDAQAIASLMLADLARQHASAN